MPHWQLFYHIVTATKGRRPSITEEIEPELYQFIFAKAQDLESRVYAVNGTFDHIHIVASIPPKIAVSTFIGQVKGFSSGQINKRHPHILPFAWQEDYGVFSFDRKRLDPVLEYVRGQKDHHRLGRLITILERCEDERFRIAEQPAIYDAGQSTPDNMAQLDELPW